MALTLEKVSAKDSKANRSFFPQKEKQKSLFFQPKLTIGPVDDVYEREADAVADKVMRMNDTGEVATTSFPINIQRKCAACEEEEKLQRKENGTNKDEAEAPSIVSDALGSGGNPLDNSARLFMESRFGYDFSNVKVHTDSVAAKSAQSINAVAYTSGNDIVFNEGQYAPTTDNGKRLIGHELTHVIQQSSGVVRRYGHDKYCDQSKYLEPFIWPGHANALSMLQNVLSALKSSDPKITQWAPIFFGKDALSHLTEITNAYERINSAIQEEYMYHCNDGSNQNSDAKKCHGQRAETELGACIFNCNRDITLCFNVIDGSWTSKDVAVLIIHENYHRAFGRSAHPYGLNDPKSGGPPDCGQFILSPPTDNLLLTNPDSYGCLASMF
jgi:hypothetical protein